MNKKPFLLGLTGSIGMGKSTTARMFAKAGIPVWDADASVHRLYAKGGGAVELIRRLNPDVVTDGAVDRGRLKEWIQRDSTALHQIESIIHPLVSSDREAFIARAHTPIVVLDIPLLYESGSEDQFDAVAVVSAPPDLQRERVLQRPGMTNALFRTILQKQLPDDRKRAKADYVIDTTSLEKAHSRVCEILTDINRKRQNA